VDIIQWQTHILLWLFESEMIFFIEKVFKPVNMTLNNEFTL